MPKQLHQSIFMKQVKLELKYIMQSGAKMYVKRLSSHFTETLDSSSGAVTFHGTSSSGLDSFRRRGVVPAWALKWSEQRVRRKGEVDLWALGRPYVRIIAGERRASSPRRARRGELVAD